MYFHGPLCLFLNIWLLHTVVCVDEEFKEIVKETAKEQGIDPDNLQPGQMLFSPPDMSEEEEGSRFMPSKHRCDGCIAVAYQFENKAFPEAEKTTKKGESLKEYEVIDAAENLCNNGFENEYGLKNVNGVNKLSGEGLPSENEPGMMEAGGRWQARLQNLCKELIETYDEDGIYQMYRDRGDEKLASNLCAEYCSGKENWRDEL